MYKIESDISNMKNGTVMVAMSICNDREYLSSSQAFGWRSWTQTPSGTLKSWNPNGDDEQDVFMEFLSCSTIFFLSVISQVHRWIPHRYGDMMGEVALSILSKSAQYLVKVACCIFFFGAAVG